MEQQFVKNPRQSCQSCSVHPYAQKNVFNPQRSCWKCSPQPSQSSWRLLLCPGWAGCLVWSRESGLFWFEFKYLDTICISLRCCWLGERSAELAAALCKCHIPGEAGRAVTPPHLQGSTWGSVSSPVSWEGKEKFLGKPSKCWGGDSSIPSSHLEKNPKNQKSNSTQLSTVNGEIWI